MFLCPQKKCFPLVLEKIQTKHTLAAESVAVIRNKVAHSRQNGTEGTSQNNEPSPHHLPSLFLLIHVRATLLPKSGAN